MRREVHREMLLDIFHAGGSFERSYGYDKAVSVRPENDHEFREAYYNSTKVRYLPIYIY